MPIFALAGVVFEALDGSLKGSMSFQICTPKESRTGMTVIEE